MEIYVILVMLLLPGKDAPKLELKREIITASSFSVCQTRADTLADEQRQLNAGVIKKQGAKVIGRCYSEGKMA